MSSSSSSSSPFLVIQLREELVLEVAGYLPPLDLLHLQSISKKLSVLNLDSVWKQRCIGRWESWPRYRLTPSREEELENHEETSGMTWKQRYWCVEREATRTTLRESDLLELEWFLSFVLSGIRGEGLSDYRKVVFAGSSEHDYNGTLTVPGYAPLPYLIVQRSPGDDAPRKIRKTLHGDRPFSRRQHLKIGSLFPPACISRKASDAEWLIANENIVMVSRGRKSDN